jgi:hypothetical protein
MGSDVVNPEDGVRITHAYDRRRMQDRFLDRPDAQIDDAGILELFGKRDLVPCEPGFAHVDRRDQRPVALPAAQQSGRRFQCQRAFASFLE